MKRPEMINYVHGYDTHEQDRLHDQASILVDLLHADTSYPDGSRVLEVGCGVGAQTLTLARRSPGARFTSIDIAEDLVARARKTVETAGLHNVEIRQADLHQHPFRPGSFDHAFVCFVLEHLSRPLEALRLLRRLLVPGGTITVIEGDHGSVYFHPENHAALRSIECLIELQKRAGGNALIGRQLYPLLTKADFQDVLVSPRMVYVDASRPALVEAFTEKTFTAMIEGIRTAGIRAGLASKDTFDNGIRGLRRTMEPDGVFGYTFFKAVGTTPPLSGRS